MKPSDNNGRTHEPSLRELSAEFDGFRELMGERHDRYKERDDANKEATRKAFEAAERAAEKVESALKEYKAEANEWRGTVKDLISAVNLTATDVSSKAVGAGLTIDRLIQIITFLGTIGIGIGVFAK